MKSQRRLIFIAALMAAAVLACAPAGAQAGSLLSGYGGPGQGSQALLGATLIGAGGSSSSGGSGGPSGPAALEVSASSAPRSAAGGSTRRSHTRHAASTAPSAGAEKLLRPPLARFHETGAGSSVLGLSGTDFLYIIAVLAGLALVAVLTRGASRGTRPGTPD